MKKVTAFVGSARKKHTYDAVRRFVDYLQALGDVECEIVALSDYRYHKEKGWSDADYFHPTRLGPLKKAMASLFDAVGTRMARKRAG